MNLQEVFDGLPKWSDRLAYLKEDRSDQAIKIARTPLKNIEYYRGKHPILTSLDRKNIYRPKFATDDAGNVIKDPSTGKAKVIGTEVVERTKLILPYERQIIATKVAMLFGEPITLLLNNDDNDDLKDLFEHFKRVWSRVIRLDSHSKKLCEAVAVETHAAELFFTEEREDGGFDVKVMLLCRENGDDIYPFFNHQRKLEALVRQYKQDVIEGGRATSKNMVEIWTKGVLYVSQDAGLTFEENILPYNKLPIVYYDQRVPEWEYVRKIIDKLEHIFSQLSDSNKRMGNPAVKVKGKIVKMPDPGADTKVFHVNDGVDPKGNTLNADVNYLESKTAPESIKLEVDQLESVIYKNTWADLFFLMSDTLGADPSGTAIKLRMTPLDMQKEMANIIYQEGLSRRINVIKAMLSVTENVDGDGEIIQGADRFNNLDISFRFNSFFPENIRELVEIYGNAVNDRITSRENAVQSLDAINKNGSQVLDQIIQEEQNNLQQNAGV